MFSSIHTISYTPEAFTNKTKTKFGNTVKGQTELSLVLCIEIALLWTTFSSPIYIKSHHNLIFYGHDDTPEFTNTCLNKYINFQLPKKWKRNTYDPMKIGREIAMILLPLTELYTWELKR